MESEIDDSMAKEAFGKITRRQLLELDTCARCALCAEKCPAYAESKKPNHAPSVRSAKTVRLYNKKFSLLAKLLGSKPIRKKEIDDLADSAYHCTLCGRCMETCPFGFQTHELWTRVREVVHDLDGTLTNISMLEEMLDDSQNP